MITKEQFFNNVANLPDTIISGKQHKKYTIIKVFGNRCKGQRESGSHFEINLDALYEAYINNDKVNTKTLLDGGYIIERKRSPSIAIMISAGLIDSDGYCKK